MAGVVTLIQTIAGMHRPARGSIRFRGTEIGGLPSHRVCNFGIGQVAEGRQIFPTLSVNENLEVGAMLPRARGQRAQNRERVFALFPSLAHTAADILIRNAHEPPPSLVRLCHEGLRTTRGVAMSVASFAWTSHTVSWLGVGNVECSLFRGNGGSRPKRESLLLRGGVVGYQLPKLLPSVVPVGPGDTLVFVTDGIGRYPLEGPWTTEQPARIAEDILARFARSTDDALVLVARYRGEAS